MTNTEDEKLKEILAAFGKGLVPGNLPETVPYHQELAAIAKFYNDLCNQLKNIADGRLENEIAYKGPLAGALKSLQASLLHLAWQASEVANGDFSQRVEFMGDFADSFNQMVENLKESFQKFEEKNNELIKFKSEFDKDIKLAEDAQNRMMQFIGQTSFARGEKYYAALQRVSGDFYHEFLDKDGNLNIFVGDATGHGVSAGLVTMMARTAIESVAKGMNTASMLSRVNSLLCHCLPDDMYISGVIARLAADGSLVVCSAGHFPVVIIRAADSSMQLTQAGVCPLACLIRTLPSLKKNTRSFCPVTGFIFLPMVLLNAVTDRNNSGSSACTS
jgi:hypothetical protein